MTGSTPDGDSRAGMRQHIPAILSALIFPACTGMVVMLKSILLLGLILDSPHVQLLTRAGPRETWWNFPFHFGFIALFTSLAFLFKNRQRLWYLFGFNLATSILFLADILYYRGFNAMPTPMTLAQTANLHNLSASILALVNPTDVLFILDLPILLGAILLLPAWGSDSKRRSGLALTFIMACLILLIWRPLLDVRAGRDLKFTTYSKFDSTFTCRVMSPLGYHLYTISRVWNESHRIRLTDQDRLTIQNWFTRNQESLPDNHYKGMFKGMNLIIIQVESLETFIINRSLDSQEITPNLNRILKHSFYFKDFYEQTNEGTSSDADLMANTSIFPVHQGSAFFRYPHTKYNSLPVLLKARGYSTVAVEPDEGSLWNWMAAQKSIGFDRCLDISRFQQDEIVNLGLSDASFLRQLRPIIQAQKSPFYLLTCTLTSHTPFILPPQYCELKLPDVLEGTHLGGYFQCFHYTDKQIGLLLDALDKAGVLDHTVVALYGDHEGIHKYLKDEVTKLSPPESWWSENHKHVPFIIYQKHLQGETIDTTGGQIDILPTLAYLLGIEENAYAATVMGRNLLKTTRNFALLRDGMIMGKPANEIHAAHIRQGLDIADMIIRGNYFR